MCTFRTAVAVILATTIGLAGALVSGCAAKEDPKIAITNGAAATAGTRPASTGPAATVGTSGTARGPGSTSGAGSGPIPSIKQSATPTAGNAITIKDYAFQPDELTVKVGATVTWTNLETDPPTQHWVRSDTDPAAANGLDSGKLAPNATYSKTFAQPGTVTYYCEIHNVMKGKIVVTS